MNTVSSIMLNLQFSKLVTKSMRYDKIHFQYNYHPSKWWKYDPPVFQRYLTLWTSYDFGYSSWWNFILRRTFSSTSTGRNSDPTTRYSISKFVLVSHTEKWIKFIVTFTDLWKALNARSTHECLLVQVPIGLIVESSKSEH